MFKRNSLKILEATNQTCQFLTLKKRNAQTKRKKKKKRGVRHFCVNTIQVMYFKKNTCSNISGNVVRT